MRNFDRGLKTFVLLFILWTAPMSMASPQSATQPSGGALQVVCTLEQPIVAPHKRVTVTVLAGVPQGSAVHYEWTATAGGFASPSQGALSKQGDAATVQWDPDGAAPGSYTLSAQATDANGASGSCSLAVLVIEEQGNRSPAGGGGLGKVAMRALLVKGRQPRKGYGLYSYILAKRPMAAGDSERLRAVLQEYLLLEDTNLEQTFKLSELNITYVPVITRSPQDPPELKWVLDDYDYPRALALLESLHKDHKIDGDGPFIVSAIQPLPEGGDYDGSCVIQDLSTVPVSIIPLWMKQFRSQTTQQRVWEGKTIGNLALQMRTFIAIAAEGLPMVQQAVAAYVK